jgi:biopolymer transport protein ExbD
LLRSTALGFVRDRGKRSSGSASLNMASFLDVLLVTVLFLLQSFSASAECPGPNVRVPVARNGEDMIEAPLVSVSHGTILVDGAPAGSVREAVETGRLTRIDELGKILEQKRALWLRVQPRRPFPGVCVLQIDQDVPAVVVKSVFATVVRAGYPEVSFMVRRLPPG